MKHRSLHLPLVLAMLTGCSRASEPLVCGDSFCLPKGTKLISRESPVEDFVLYRVEANGERFLIYEGSHPKRAPGSVVLTAKKDHWPAFVEISGPCESKQDCAVKSFAAKVVIR